MKKNSKINAIIIVSLLVVISTIAITSSKYVYNSVWNYYLKSREFYFESDLLEINTKKNSILDWDGSDISFDLRNNQNSEHISEFDISYKVTCEVLGEESKYIGCKINNLESSSFEGTLSNVEKCVNELDETDVSKLTKAECEIGGYNWTQELITKTNNFNLFLTDPTKNINEVSVKIIAESTKPYKKTLTGIFNLNKVDITDSTYDLVYQKFSEYDELTIINKTSTDRCFSLSFDAEEYLLISDTDGYEFEVDSNNKINKINFNIKKNSSINFNFFRLDLTKEYSVNNFSIVEKDC